jgi:hypothetical protein
MSLHRSRVCRTGTLVAVVGALGLLAATAAVGAVTGPVAATGSAPPLNVVIQWDPATPASERKLWTIYLYTRAAATAAETEHESLPIGEHPPSFNEEVRARLLAVNLYRQLRRSEPALSSVYFADLDRVEAAGYLREYVWRYLRSGSWTHPPEGLELASFDAWRHAHLRHHVPVTYGRIALRRG